MENKSTIELVAEIWERFYENILEPKIRHGPVYLNGEVYHMTKDQIEETVNLLNVMGKLCTSSPVRYYSRMKEFLPDRDLVDTAMDGLLYDEEKCTLTHAYMFPQWAVCCCSQNEFDKIKKFLDFFLNAYRDIEEQLLG